MALSFAALDASFLPSEIVDKIALTVHKNFFTSIAADITTRVNVLDKAVEDDVTNIRDYLKSLGARELVDEYADWMTLAYILDEKTKHFVLYHHFVDGPYDNYKILIEGTVTGADNTVRISRIFHHNTLAGDISYPLELVTSQQWSRVDIDHQTVLSWRNPQEIIQKFTAVA